MAEKDIKWSAPEFQHYEKSANWYLASLAVAALLLIFALWQRNILFAVFIVIAEILFLKMGRQLPHQMDFRLSNLGIEIGGKKSYSYDDLAGFATRRLDQHEDGLSELILKRKRHFSTYVKVLFPTKHSDELRVFINKYLPEIEYEDSLVEHLAKLLKF
ncbi:MAG: hypothetical protein HYT03_01535 [Candidatus Harrisonbacteria bacterium]|nr:hypothetical protein [Candidatus Harrisonbacteria bacterium]